MKSTLNIHWTDAEAPIPCLPDAKIQLIGKDPEAGKDWGQEEKGGDRGFDGITDSMDMNLSKLQETVKYREAWHATVHSIMKSWTWLSDQTVTTICK